MKVALSHFDDKRFMIPNSKKTLAWGHKDIRSITEKGDISSDEPSEDILDEFICLINDVLEEQAGTSDD